MSATDRPVVGQIFYVPLHEGGYAFGYVTLVDSQTGTMCDFFDLVSETPEVPAGIERADIALRDMLITGAEFISKRLGDKKWKATRHHMPHPVAPHSALFVMHSRPVYQLVDLARERSKRPATEEEIERYPNLSTYSPGFTTKLVEKAVRHLDIDANLIGTDHGDSTLH